MKNKILLSAAILASIATFSSAQADNTGCGLGTVIFQGEKGMIPDILAVTTNGTSGNQTFGISSGTLGCKHNQPIGSGKKAKIFAFTDKNMDEVALDISKGSGEYLNSVADIIGIKETDKARFFSLSQKNFSKMFANENITTANVVENIATIVNQDKVLKVYKL